MNKTVLVDVNLIDNQINNLEPAFQQVDKAISEHNNQGYRVVSVAPLITGEYGYKYSFTRGFLIVFEKV